MKNPEPTIRINVDPTNPGQFFACCGLLELADRLWDGAEGWFDELEFCLNIPSLKISLDEIISRILTIPEFSEAIDKKTAVRGSKSKLIPIHLSFPQSILTINWWRDETRPSGKASREKCASSVFKTWSGNQSPQQILYDKILPAIRKLQSKNPPDLFHQRFPLSGRFGFDYTAAVKSIDIGWSPDMHGVDVETSPVIELFAMVGLQRFRPRKSIAPKGYLYTIWSQPLPTIVASGASVGCVANKIDTTYRFCLGKRRDYKYFTKATLHQPTGDKQ